MNISFIIYYHIVHLIVNQFNHIKYQPYQRKLFEISYNSICFDAEILGMKEIIFAEK